jgi:hypothetical protein
MMNMMRSCVISALLLGCIADGSARAAEKWPGIDEAVVKKIAREHGREARDPLINTGEGDLQLFAFLMAGVMGGFVAGYCWRGLLEGKKKADEDGDGMQ